MLEQTHIAPRKSEAAPPDFHNPFTLFDRMLSEVESLWRRPLFRLVSRRDAVEKDPTWMPTFDVYEHGCELVVKADLPGLGKDDIRIYLEDGAIVVLGERKAEERVERESYSLAERNSGSFYRRLPLAFEADPSRIAARFTDGVLEVHVPLPIMEPATLRPIPVC
jgi:HSP20 family protein